MHTKLCATVGWLLLAISQLAMNTVCSAQPADSAVARFPPVALPDAIRHNAVALSGRWTVSVDGDGRRRELVLYPFALRPRRWLWAAAYGWTDGAMDPVPLRIENMADKVTMELTTPARVLIRAVVRADDEMAGTFEPRAGPSRAVSLKRTGQITLTEADSFADETRDFAVAPTASLSKTYHAKTPLIVPGGTTITTVHLWKWLTSSNPPVVVDLLDGEPGKRHCLPGAVWAGSRFGQGQVFANDERDFAALLNDVTSGDKATPIVFYCLNPECWLSYNGALRALAEGYTSVHWYRGGLHAWKAARLPMVIGDLYRP